MDCQLNINVYNDKQAKFTKINFIGIFTYVFEICKYNIIRNVFRKISLQNEARNYQFRLNYFS